MEITWIIVIVIVIIVTFYLFRVPYSSLKGGKVHFKEEISEANAAYLKECFGIEIDDCYAFRFNGEVFRLRKSISYRRINRINCESILDVRIHNPSLPHDTSWKYERVDGGPDRRYRHNVRTMTSKRYMLRFYGEEMGIMYLYDSPYRDNREVQKALDRFNIMLSLNNAVDIEEDRHNYLQAFDELKQLQASREKQVGGQKEAQNVIQAFSSLPSELRNADADLILAYRKAQDELSSIQRSLAKIDSQIKEVSNKMQIITNRVKQEIAKHESLKILREYNPESQRTSGNKDSD